MEMKILKLSKDEIEVELENVTLAEILKIYLDKDDAVSFAAWKKEHYTKKPVLLVKTKGKTAKKAISDSADSIVKDLDKLEETFKKAK